MFRRHLEVLSHIYEGMRTMSAQLSDVLTAATDLQGSIDANTAAVKAAIAAGIGVAPVDLQPAVDALNQAKASLDASTGDLTAATPAQAA